MFAGAPSPGGCFGFAGRGCGAPTVTPTNVREFAGTETIKRQLKGGVRRPKGRYLYIPVNKRGRKPKGKTFVAGKSVWVRNSRGVRRVASLAEDADVPRRFNHRRVLDRTERAMSRLLRRAAGEGAQLRLEEAQVLTHM